MSQFWKMVTSCAKMPWSVSTIGRVDQFVHLHKLKLSIQYPNSKLSTVCKPNHPIMIPHFTELFVQTMHQCLIVIYSDGIFIALQCPPLVITNDEQSVSVNTFRIGGQARFSCIPTHTLKGADSLRCLPNGEWSAKIPRCESKYVSTNLLPKNFLMSYNL